MNIFSRNEKRIVFIVIMTLVFLLSYSISHAQNNDDYVCSKVEDSIFNTLIDNGYTPAGACGILGNISIENPKFEPDLYANNGATYGLFQWSDVGNRKSFLKRWCNNRLLYHNRVEGQLAYAMYELEGGDPQASKVNNYLKNSDDPKRSAMEFAVGFERCIGGTSNPEADGYYTGCIFQNYVGKKYQALTYRMNNAQIYYDQYSVKSVNDDVALEIKPIPTAGVISEKEEEMENRLNLKMPKIAVDNSWIIFGYRVLSVVIGYAFGCILGVRLIVRNNKQKKRLKMDKKLPSLMTVFKYAGIKECILATLIDIGKLYAALLIVYLLTKGALGSEQILLVGFGVILGNAFPVWNRFIGGMGIIVTTVFICTYMPIWGYICCVLGLFVAIVFKSLPFGAICISVFAVPYAFLCKGIEGGIFITLSLIILIYKHHRFLSKFVDKELLNSHYRRNRTK